MDKITELMDKITELMDESINKLNALKTELNKPNPSDLKTTKTMEYKDLVKHHTQLIKDKNDNKWEVIETSDLEDICEAYHQHKLTKGFNNKI